MGFIKDLYYGKIKVAEDLGYNSSEEYKNLEEESTEILKHLKSNLDVEKNEMLNKYYDLSEEIYRMELERMFIYAFKLGFKSAMDITT